MSNFQKFPPSQPRIGLSFGIESAIVSALNAEDEVTAEVFEKIVFESYAIIHPKELVEQLLPHLVQRVLTRIEELKDQEEKKSSPGRRGRTFGSGYIEFISGMDSQVSCLYLANYDVDKALHYYWEEDYLLVQDAIQAKSGHESQITLTRLEASMYGFGGKYSDDAQGDTNTVHVDDMNPEDFQSAMAGFGF
jgi:Arc/MetJ family transcription regulator